MVRAKWAIAFAYGISVLLCAPIYASFSINEYLNGTIVTQHDINQRAPQVTTFARTTEVIFDEDSSSDENKTLSKHFTNDGQRSTEIEYGVNLSNLASMNPALLTANFWLYR